MQAMKNMSIKNKLISIIMATCIATLLIAGIVFSAYEWVSLRQNIVDNLSAQAEIIADNCKSSVAFKDAKDASEILRALGNDDSIVLGCIYMPDGSIFTSYYRDPEDKSLLPREFKNAGHYYSGNYLTVFKSIVLDKEVIGIVCIKSDLRHLYSMFQRNSIIIGIVVLIASLMAYLMSLKLQGIISGPILSLAGIAKSVSQQKEYSVRASKISNDEVGLLIDSFNDMLEQIQQRDMELVNSNEQLEIKVEQRTAEVQRSEQFKQAVLDSVSAHIAVLDSKGTIVATNEPWKQFARQNGLEELRSVSEGVNYLDICHKAIKEGIESALENMQGIEKILNGNIGSFEAEYRCDSPTEKRWFLMRAMPIKGINRGVVLSHENVTEQKLAEEAIRHANAELVEKQKNLETLFEASPVGILLIDDKTAIKRANEVAIEMVGKGRRELIGSQPGDVLACIHSYDDPAGCGHGPSCATCSIRNTIEGVLKTGQSVHNAEIQPTRIIDGKIISPWFEINVDPVTIDGTGQVLLTIQDITARKEASHALEESKNKLRLILDSTAEAIFGIDDKGICTFCNPTCLSMLGYKDVNELIGKNIHKLIHHTRPDGNPFPAEECHFFQAFKKGEKAHSEDELLWKADGTSFHAEYWSHPQLDGDKVVGTVATFIDITDRKRAQDQIALNERRLESLMKISQYKTDSIQSLLDYALDEAISLTNSKIGYIFHYDEQTQIFTLNSWSKEAMKECLMADKPAIYELDKTGIWGEPVRQRKAFIVNDYSLPHPHKKGYPASHVTVKSLLTIPVFMKGKIVAVVGVGNRDTNYDQSDVRQMTLLMDSVWNIVDRRRAEDELRQQKELLSNVVSNIPHTVFWKDRNSIYLGCNETFARAAGIGKPEGIVGKTDYELPWKKEEADWYRECDKKVMDAAKPLLDIEETQLRADGTSTTILTSKVPMLDSTGKAVGMLGIYSDITERKLAEEKQARLLEEIKSANQELSDFAHVVSHDLKAPLRGIKALSDWIATDYADKLDENGRQQFHLLSTRVDRMHQLIDGILQYSKIGREKEALSAVDLNALLPDIIDMASAPSNITITVENQLPVMVCDPSRIRQVFGNLLSNAVKYIDKPKGTIKIDCRSEGEFWQFSVSDNGPGIEAKYFDKIFNLFQTLTPRDSYESTGIGLTIVKKIVETYGGKIWIESKVGEGCKFLFTLPKNHKRGKE